MELNNSSVKANEPTPVMMPLSTTFYSALFIQKERESKGSSQCKTPVDYI